MALTLTGTTVVFLLPVVLSLRWPASVSVLTTAIAVAGLAVFVGLIVSSMVRNIVGSESNLLVAGKRNDWSPAGNRVSVVARHSLNGLLPVVLPAKEACQRRPGDVVPHAEQRGNECGRRLKQRRRQRDG